MNKTDLFNNLAKYFSGESSAEEIEKIKAWLNTDKKNKVLFDEMESVWQSTKAIQRNFDSDKAWASVKSKLLYADKKSVKKNNFVFNEFFFKPGLIKIAASIAVLVLLSLFALNQFRSSNSAEIISSGKNEIKKVRLNDGTFVTLNSESRLTITENFNKKDRIVDLSGEAYFEVSPDKKKPFLVNTVVAKVKVIGTKFNLTAWDEDLEVTLAVTEGSVSFNSSSNQYADAVIVNKDEVSFVASDGKPLSPFKLDVEKYYFFWLNDELNFYNASFKSVIQRLEMKYNIDIAVDDTAILSKHLTANFKDEPLSEVINTISIALNLGYSVNKTKIVFNFLQSSKK